MSRRVVVHSTGAHEIPWCLSVMPPVGGAAGRRGTTPSSGTWSARTPWSGNAAAPVLPALARASGGGCGAAGVRPVTAAGRRGREGIRPAPGGSASRARTP